MREMLFFGQIDFGLVWKRQLSLIIWLPVVTKHSTWGHSGRRQPSFYVLRGLWISIGSGLSGCCSFLGPLLQMQDVLLRLGTLWQSCSLDMCWCWLLWGFCGSLSSEVQPGLLPGSLRVQESKGRSWLARWGQGSELLQGCSASLCWSVQVPRPA